MAEADSKFDSLFGINSRTEISGLLPSQYKAVISRLTDTMEAQALIDFDGEMEGGFPIRRMCLGALLNAKDGKRSGLTIGEWIKGSCLSLGITEVAF